jgi:hypothetical protein
VSGTVGGPTLHAFCKPATVVVPATPAAHYVAADTTFHRRLKNTDLGAAPSRRHFETGRVRLQPSKKPARCLDGLKQKVPSLFSAILLFVGSVGWCWPVFSELRSAVLVSPAEASIRPHISHCQRLNRCRGKADSEIGKLDPFSSSTYAPSANPHVARTLGTSLSRQSAAIEHGPAPAKHAAKEPKPTLKPPVRLASLERAAPLAEVILSRIPSNAGALTSRGREKPARIVARERSRLRTLVAERGRASAKHAAKEPKPTLKPPVRLASLEDAAPPVHAIPSRSPSNAGALTSLVDFETAPFPYHGTMPESGRPFLNAGTEGHRGHVNFRGHVLWESQTFSDDRVLLHIPPGFDPKRPAVMVVFFHGHGANLAQDVRDRQQVPTQITAAGVNAVLVAPQFAVDAADSSAGKFWEPNGFRRFLDEAADKLARMYGDPRSAFTFASMPIVIVAYSGGFGPTLSVLDQGGVRSRVRGLVLLDALYGGIGKFADWITYNRSTFFVSSYTPHTARHNAYLERLLRERSVPYSSELRNSHLRGMVTFLPAGDISHRDFVTRAWADNPIKDILVRMDDAGQRIETARTTGSSSAVAVASKHN